MTSYEWGRIFGALFMAVLAGALLWTGLQRRRRGENGTAFIAIGAVLAVGFLVSLARGLTTG